MDAENNCESLTQQGMFWELALRWRRFDPELSGTEALIRAAEDIQRGEVNP